MCSHEAFPLCLAPKLYLLGHGDFIATPKDLLDKLLAHFNSFLFRVPFENGGKLKWQVGVVQRNISVFLSVFPLLYGQKNMYRFIERGADK